MTKAKDNRDLITALGYMDTMRQWDEYKGILYLLRDAGKEAVEPLIEALRDTNPLRRYGAVVVLGDLADPRAVEPLINALRDENPDVRRQAAISLGMIGDVRTVKPLMTC
jgi:HEAT repeat protein